jgi:hypothetical protein
MAVKKVRRNVVLVTPAELACITLASEAVIMVLGIYHILPSHTHSFSPLLRKKVLRFELGFKSGQHGEYHPAFTSPHHSESQYLPSSTSRANHTTRRSVVQNSSRLSFMLPLSVLTRPAQHSEAQQEICGLARRLLDPSLIQRKGRLTSS